jgi:dihydrofolate reductase
MTAKGNAMRKIIVKTEMSLDGVLDNPKLWGLITRHQDDAVKDYFRDQLFATDALLMGRITYEAFSKSWPPRAGTDDIADRINTLPKFVASRTLKEPLTWNATLLKSDAAEEVARLKQQPGQAMLQYGAGELTHTLLQHGLIDELRFLVYPVMVGSGQRIFDTIDVTIMKLLDTKTFSTGVIALHYQPQRKE